MVLGIPAITFAALLIQPVIIVFTIVWAKYYDKFIEMSMFFFLKEIDEEFEEAETGSEGGKTV